MTNKAIILILTLLFSSIPACSFKVSTENNQASSNTAKVEENTKAIEKSALSDSDSSALSQTGGKTGTYKYKSDGVNNEISIQELEGNKLRVELHASYEYEINGNLNANVGEAKGIATLNGNTAVLLPEETEGCEIALSFSGNKLIVKPKNESKNCGFGLNVSAEGTYTKASSKPDFGDSDENPASTQNSTNSEQNSKTGRIRFAKGKSSAVVSGKIISKQDVTYLIGARKGQTLEVKITAGGENNDVVFYLIAPDGSFPMGEDDEGFDTAWKEKLQQTGDYKIVLGTIESKNANFKMSVSIR